MNWRASLAGGLIVVAAGFGVGLGIGGKTKTTTVTRTKTATRTAAATTGGGTTTDGGTTTGVGATTPGGAATTYLLNVPKAGGDTPMRGATTIGGTTFNNSVWYADTCEPCSTRYALRGRYKAFESSIGLKDTAGEFELDVMVDGVTVCTKQVSGGDQAVPVRVSVAGKHQLTLTSVDQDAGGTPVWGDAKLVASGVAPSRCS